MLIDYEKWEYLQSADDPFKDFLIRLIVRNSKVRTRMMYELIDAEQDDHFMPDDWIYHRDMKINDVLKYIRKYYDDLRMED